MRMLCWKRAVRVALENCNNLDGSRDCFVEQDEELAYEPRCLPRGRNLLSDTGLF